MRQKLADLKPDLFAFASKKVKDSFPHELRMPWVKNRCLSKNPIKRRIVVDAAKTRYNSSVSDPLFVLQNAA